MKVRVTRKELNRLKKSLYDCSFIAQRRVWHLMEPRMRDARRGETKDNEHVLGFCKAVTEEESWSGCNQGKEQVGKTNQRDQKTPQKSRKKKNGKMLV